jgi:hypothetical protein
VSRPQFLRRILGGDGDTAIFSALLYASNPSNFFDDACEHECLLNERDILNPFLGVRPSDC